jgi:hypothetical protein
MWMPAVFACVMENSVKIVNFSETKGFLAIIVGMGGAFYDKSDSDK